MAQQTKQGALLALVNAAKEARFTLMSYCGHIPTDDKAKARLKKLEQAIEGIRQVYSPDAACEESESYWHRMRAEGFWVDGQGCTDKAFREWLK